MRTFTCGHCANLLAFENSVCVVCGSPQAFSTEQFSMVVVDQSETHQLCGNAALIGCNWLIADGERFCPSCRLTRTRPREDDTSGMVAFAGAEAAKRRLVYQLMDLALPVIAKLDDAAGLAFDLLSSTDAPVTTGHADGVVTIDLAEGDDPHREAMRVEMGEPYRTMLGHLRHEVGHYYFQVLVEGRRPGAGDTHVGDAIERFRTLFGDERPDYGDALRRHYTDGPPLRWEVSHISAYATAHPWEDWAETFAHYLHILDTLQTASSWGMVVAGPSTSAPEVTGAVHARPASQTSGEVGISEIIATWLPLTYALNAVNRSMGKEDLYPFRLTESVIAKLDFVHRLVNRS